MDRRKFLKQATYFTVASASVTLTACGGGGGGAGSTRPTGIYQFSHGVASGDPKATSVVFWTRCVRVGSGSGDIALKLEVSASNAFGTLAASVDLSASDKFDFTVRAKVTGLNANSVYFYRFVADGDISPVGQTKTAPAAEATPTQINFAWMTCQDWSINHWGAMELLAAENLDFVVHLGDYIYETVGAGFQTGAAEPAHGKITLPNGIVGSGGSVYANTLEDYRSLYRTYRSDNRLQEIHRRFPMIAIWDDHEFSDDSWQDRQTYTNENKAQTSRRRDANQAWAEYMPIDFGDVSFDLAKTGFDNIRIYRDFRFGSLMHLVMTDQRLYRDDHVVPESTIANLQGRDPIGGNDFISSRYFVPQTILQAFERQATAALQRPPSILGVTQTEWWKQTMKASTATWKVWGNEVTLGNMLLDMRGRTAPPFDQVFVVNADVWDGYPTHRAELMNYVKNQNISNLVAITGDLHSFQCAVIRDNANPVTGTAVAVDFVGAGISSSSSYTYFKDGAGTTPLAALVASPASWNGILQAFNPDFAYIDQDAQGYVTASVTSSSFTVWFNKVKPLNPDGTKPASPLLKRTKITLAAGSNRPVVEDNVA
jgi:alkaline phosphatase D